MPDDLKSARELDREAEASARKAAWKLMSRGRTVFHSGAGTTRGPGRRLFVPDTTRPAHPFGRTLLERRQLGRVALRWFTQLVRFEQDADADDEFGPFIGMASVILEGSLARLVTYPAFDRGLLPALSAALAPHAAAHGIEADELASRVTGVTRAGRPPGRPTLITHQAVAFALGYALRDPGSGPAAFARTVFPASCLPRLADLTFARAVHAFRADYRNPTAHPPDHAYGIDDYRRFSTLAVGARSFVEWNLYVAADGPPADAKGIMNPLARGGSAAAGS